MFHTRGAFKSSDSSTMAVSLSDHSDHLHGLGRLASIVWSWVYCFVSRTYQHGNLHINMIRHWGSPLGSPLNFVVDMFDWTYDSFTLKFSNLCLINRLQRIVFVCWVYSHMFRIFRKYDLCLFERRKLRLVCLIHSISQFVGYRVDRGLW